jgi:hypothetical protein
LTLPYVVIALDAPKNKREPENPELNSDETGFVLEPTPIEIGSGYALQLSLDQNEKTIVDVKTYGEIDIRKLRREIERMFPNAQIRQLSQNPTVTVVKKAKSKGRHRKK